MTKKLFDFEKLDDGWELVKYNYNADPAITSVEIPEKYKFKKVKSIGTKAFSAASFLKSVNIPDTVTNIGTSAFEYCESLEDIRLPSGLKIVDYCCFRLCTSLETITLPAKCAVIRSFAFAGCSQLKTAALSEMMCVIFNNAFEDCVSLTDVLFPHPTLGPQGSVTLGKSAFKNCSSLSTECAMYSLIGENDLNKPFAADTMEDKWDTALRRDVFLKACELSSFKNVNKTELIKRIIDRDLIDYMPLAEKLLSEKELDELVDYSSAQNKTEFTARLLNFKNGAENSAVEDIIDARFSL